MGRNREVIDGEAALTMLCHAETDGLPDEVAACDALKAKIKSARGDARMQLYDGPSAREACDLSWEAAIEVLRKFWSDNGLDLWVHEDDNTDVCLAEPEHDHTCDDECRSDGCWFNFDPCYRCVDAGDVGRAIFGAELFQYIK